MTKHTVSDSDALRAATSFSLLDRSTARLRPLARPFVRRGGRSCGPLHEDAAKPFAEPGSPVPEAPTTEMAADLLSHAGASPGSLKPAGGPARHLQSRTGRERLYPCGSQPFPRSAVAPGSAGRYALRA